MWEAFGVYYKTLVCESEGDYESNLDYIRKYKEDKDQAVLMWLIRNNARLIHKAVKPYANFYSHKLDYDDLFSAGIEGLIKSIERFDFSYNTMFSTYATPWVKQCIERALITEGFTIRVPERLFHKVKQVIEHVHEAERCEIYLSKEEVCAELSLPFDDYECAKQVYRSTIMLASLNMYVSNGEGVEELQDILATNNGLQDVSESEDPETLAIENEAKRALQQCLSVLKPQEAHIITRYYGLDGQEAMTYLGLSETEGLSRQRVRMLEASAFRHLRCALRRHYDRSIPALNM